MRFPVWEAGHHYSKTSLSFPHFPIKVVTNVALKMEYITVKNRAKTVGFRENLSPCICEPFAVNKDVQRVGRLEPVRIPPSPFFPFVAGWEPALSVSC